MFRFVSTLLLVLALSQMLSQSILSYSDSLNTKKLMTVVGVESVGTIGSLVALNSIWYEQYPKVSFHSFNDNSEWLQLDKAGHVLSAYFIGHAGIEAMNWAGVEERKAIWIGGGVGVVYLTGLEILDGYSSGWGFSKGDMIANGIGMGVLVTQELVWKEQRIQIKFSAHHTNYARFRPELLGSNGFQRLLKDYNGQTYWLSVNLKSFLFKEKKFPAWLNIAFGYSANEMISGSVGSYNNCSINSWCNGLERYRQWYFSFDIDLTKISVKHPLLKTIFGTFGFVKIPAPTLEYSKNRIQLKGFYF